MAINHHYPYTDIHDLNLDWILAKMKELKIEFDEFKVVNQISFSGAWDITKNYPAWTIVSDNNIGYVSIQPVPAGVLLTNGDYWREVIDYTAQIAGLQSRVVALENTVGDNSSGLVKDVNDIQTDITDIQADINDILLADFSNRNFLFVGDSYADQSDSWVTPLVSMLNITNYSNEAVSGAAFNDSSFLSQIQNYAGDKDAITDIFVGGGLNDSIYASVNTDYNNTVSAIQAFATYAKANYPNARLWLAFMGNAIDDAPLLSGRTWNKREWAKWTYELVGPEYGYSIIKGCDYALATSVANYKADHIHPGSYGAKAIALVIANQLRGCPKVIEYPWYQITLTPIGNNVAMYSPKLYYNIHDNLVHFVTSDNFGINIATDYNTFTANDIIDLFTMSNIYFNNKVFVPINVRLDKYNNKNYQSLTGTLIFDGSKIQMCFDTINSAGTGFETYTAMNSSGAILIGRQVDVSVPLEYIN